MGVLVDSFQKADGTALLTPAQSRWLEVERVVKRMKAGMRVDRPVNRLRALCFDFVVHPWFDAFITGVIVINICFMATFHSNMSATWELVLAWANAVFLVIYILEAALKITAFGKKYFSSPEHMFDFAIVAGSVVSLLVPDSIALGSQAARMFRVFRAFRFASRSPGVRSLFQTLYLSLPSIANLMLLMSLAVFIFAVIGNQVREALLARRCRV